MRLGLMELIIIFAIVLLVFGAKQIPKLTKAVKDAKSELKDSTPEGGAIVSEATEK